MAESITNKSKLSNHYIILKKIKKELQTSVKGQTSHLTIMWILNRIQCLEKPNAQNHTLLSKRINTCHTFWKCTKKPNA